MTPRLDLDHLVISAETLAEGTAVVEKTLGVTLSEVGHHQRMGTHNRLLSLGPDAYLEVIAIDPDAAPPPHPRWFDIDRFAGPPRLTNWVCRTDDLDALLPEAPAGSGRPIVFARGDFRWRMAVPEDGRPPFDGAVPALIEWETEAHPAPRLPDAGVRLAGIEVVHPKATLLAEGLLGKFP